MTTTVPSASRRSRVATADAASSSGNTDPTTGSSCLESNSAAISAHCCCGYSGGLGAPELAPGDADDVQVVQQQPIDRERRYLPAREADYQHPTERAEAARASRGSGRRRRCRTRRRRLDPRSAPAPRGEIRRRATVSCAPDRRASAAFSGVETTARTRAPRARAYCTAAEPSPPPAPCTRTVSTGLQAGSAGQREVRGEVVDGGRGAGSERHRVRQQEYTRRVRDRVLGERTAPGVNAATRSPTRNSRPTLERRAPYPTPGGRTRTATSACLDSGPGS